MSTLARNTQQVTQALQAAGYKGVQLMKGRGCFYFTGSATSHWKETKVYVDSISRFSVERWIKEYERLAQQDKRADREAFEDDVLTKLNTTSTGKTTVPTSKLTRIQTGLVELGKRYWNSALPDALTNLITEAGLTLLDDDGTPFQGVLTGREGKATIALGLKDTTPTTSVLHLQWHKMETGKYELNGYLSTI